MSVPEAYELILEARITSESRVAQPLEIRDAFDADLRGKFKRLLAREAPLGEFASRFVTRDSGLPSRGLACFSQVFFASNGKRLGSFTCETAILYSSLRTLHIISDRLNLPLSCRHSRCGSGSRLSRLEFLSFAKPEFAKFGSRDS